MSALLLPTLLPELLAHRPFDAEEAASKDAIVAFVRATPAFAERATLVGHVTASGWVLNAIGTEACLVLHGKYNVWLQPGGHVEAFDASVADAALREVVEETGIPADQLARGALFDVDAHPIAARGEVPAHVHYDLRYLFRAAAGARVQLTAESKGIKFVPLTELAMNPDAFRVQRMAQKSLAAAAG